jgi:hypothetical protein
MKQLTIRQMQAIDNMYKSINRGNEYIIYLHALNNDNPIMSDEALILLRAMDKIKNGIETYENREKLTKEE